MFRLAMLLFILLTQTVSGLTVVNFNATTNNRFSSGYPGTPQPNGSGSFIGSGMDRVALTAALDAALVPEDDFQPRNWADLADPFPLWRRQAA